MLLRITNSIQIRSLGINFELYISLRLEYSSINNPTQKMKYSKEQVLWFLYVPFCSIICFAGIIGNILSLVIWHRLRSRSGIRNISTTTYFMILSALDIGVLVMSLLVMTLPYADTSLYDSRAFAVFFSYIGHPLHFFLIFVSFFMVVAMSLDRVRLVFRPFSRYNKNQQVAYTTIGLFTGWAFLLNILSFFEFRPVQHRNGEWKLIEIRYLYKRGFRNAVFIMHCVGVIILPWLAMFVSNVLLIYKMYNLHFSNNYIEPVGIDTKQTGCKSDAGSPSHNPFTGKILKGHRRDHRKITRTLLTVSIVSLVLLSIQCVAKCLTMFYYIDNQDWPHFHFAREMGNLAFPINSSINVLLFGFSAKSFRNRLRMILVSSLSVILGPAESRRISPIRPPHRIDFRVRADPASVHDK